MTKPTQQARVTDTVDPIVLPNRLRLAASAVLLAVITLFDPSIMRGMLIAWHRSNQGEAKRWKARVLCGQNPTDQAAEHKTEE